MKHTLIALAVAGTLALTSTAAAANGLITINGYVENTTCLVNGAAPGAGAQDIPVTLPNVSVSALAAAGQRAGASGYNVVVGGAGDAGCEDGKVAKVHFEANSQSIDAATGRLNNDESVDHATNVQVAIKNADDSDIDLRDSSNSQEVEIVNNTATLRYTAEYVATGAVVGGRVSTRVQYSMVYN